MRGLAPIDLALAPGEFLSLIGPSGCGKSTLLKLIANLAEPSDGRVQWWRGGFDRVGEPGRRLAFVFQDPTLMPWARIEANVRLPLGLARVPGAEARRRVAAALAQVGLQDRAKAFPRQLSGGMRMRVSIARALVTEDVHYVQVKCPLLTRARIADAEARGRSVATEDTYESMGRSRGASALGVALALGEVAASALPSDHVICRDWSLWSARASTSAGIELMENQVIVLGNSAAWRGDLVIGHGVMVDALDVGAAVGIEAAGQLGPADRGRVAAVLAKAEPSRTGLIRGRRHTMLDDSDINATRHARALVGGVLAAVVGDTELFVSGGAEHQGPDGGGPVAVVARGVA